MRIVKMSGYYLNKVPTAQEIEANTIGQEALANVEQSLIRPILWTLMDIEIPDIADRIEVLLLVLLNSDKESRVADLTCDERSGYMCFYDYSGDNGAVIPITALSLPRIMEMIQKSGADGPQVVWRFINSTIYDISYEEAYKGRCAAELETKARHEAFEKRRSIFGSFLSLSENYGQLIG